MLSNSIKTYALNKTKTTKHILLILKRSLIPKLTKRNHQGYIACNSTNVQICISCNMRENTLFSYMTYYKLSNKAFAIRFRELHM